MNSVWIKHIKSNVRILLLNNYGAAEFHFGYGKEILPEINDYTAAEHFRSAKQWVEDNQFTYLSAHNIDDIHKCLDVFCNPDAVHPMVLEVFTDKENDGKTAHILADYNKQENLKDISKKMIKSVIGMQNVEKIKNIIKKKTD